MKRSVRVLVNKIFGRVERFFLTPKLRILKTVYINFRSLPINQAFKFPIFIYGNYKIYSLNGKIEIHGGIRPGMVKVGNPIHGAVIEARTGYIRNQGVIKIFGPVQIVNGVSINIVGGELILGSNVLIGENVRIVCAKNIQINQGTRIAHESQIIDTNFHYMLNTSNKKIIDTKGDIILGKWCWVGNRTTIQKGTILPDNVIVSSNSILNKNYNGSVPEFSVIGGQPAKLLKTGVRRIFNINNEIKLNLWFKTNIDNPYLLNECNEDEFCI